MATARGQEAALVGRVRVEGNERTREPVILDAAGLSRGDRFEPDTVAEVRQRVLNLRLFREVVVVPELRGSEVDVAIRVVERWTLLPIPFVGASSRGIRGGAYLVESNLFGWNKLFVLGGQIAGEGLSGSILYRDPGVAGSRVLLRGQVRYADLLREQFDGDQLIYAYRDERLEGLSFVGYQVTPWLALFGGWYAALTGAEAEEGMTAPPESGALHGWVSDVEVRAQDFHLYFNEGFFMRASYRHALASLGSGRDVLELSGFAQYAVRVFGDQSTSLTLQGAFSDGDPILDAVLLGGLPGSRGFERAGLWAERAATVTVEHQVPVLRYRWGIWTLNAFAEAGAVSWRSESNGFFTPGAGFRLYLLGVAFPALGVDLAYSVEEGRFYAMAAFGAGSL